MARIALLSTSDTDLLCARASQRNYGYLNPSRADDAAIQALIFGDESQAAAEIVIYRLLGSPDQLWPGLEQVRAAGIPVVVLGGEQQPNAELMEYSTVTSGVASQAHVYLAQGGANNLQNLHGFLADTLLLDGSSFDPPEYLPAWGHLPGHEVAHVASTASADSLRPRVGVVFYRAQMSAGNTAYITDLCAALENAGAEPVPLYVTSLREAPPELLAELATLDVLITTVLAAGGSRPAVDDEQWDVANLSALDIPILQGLTLTWSRQEWQDSDEGARPLDVATQVAVPEFDGRIITTAFSFKENDDDGLPYYAADPERCARLARLAVAYGRLRKVPPKHRKIALMLSAYPTKHSRIGNAVGLDTPASAVLLLRALRDAGYDVGDLPGVQESAYETPAENEPPGTTPLNRAGNDLLHTLIAAGGQDPEWLSEAQLSEHVVRIPATTYSQWFAKLPADLQADMESAWGPAPGELYVDVSNPAEPEIVCAAIESGNVVVLVQPPRGFGENPIAIYHDPDLAPTHHYLATYRWIEEQFGAHAVIHLGKHGNLEWLPGKNLALSASCGTDAALGSLPLIYPFLVNDPGEGTQAKRRAAATIVDHLVPPMSRAETYGDIARLESLLDEYGNVSAMDPAKAPALRADIWALIKAANMHQELGLENRPDDESFDDFVGEVDGWLCEIKDVQIRDGLHMLGQAPAGKSLENLVLAMLQAAQIFGATAQSEHGPLPGLRACLGLPAGCTDRTLVDAAENRAKKCIATLAAAEWDAGQVPQILAEVIPNFASVSGLQPIDESACAATLTFAATTLVPRLQETTAEITQVLHALDGGYVPAGPSGSPLRGLTNVLPTGRNFYSVDPKAIPSQLAYQTGTSLADSLLQKYVAETGEMPRSVGISAWGTSAMRTSGDDIGEILALLGVTPVWDEASRRVTGLEVIPIAELGRPRIDVTVRISGFFRDAFPHVIDLIDDAIALVADLPESAADNYVRAHVQADHKTGGNARQARTRIFGSKPGSYGAGILQTIESGNWRSDADLAEVYTAWGGYAYGRNLDGAPAAAQMRTAYKRIQVAAKNVDSREHDILDSDDYFQYHGGMVATVRALTGADPRAYVGDSTNPLTAKTRTLAEESARIYRARVVNPRWMAAMRKHGYKGAFEMAATVDYLFGFDATAGVIPDWMYAGIAADYVLDETNKEFFRHANPWALHSVIEKLMEAADRELWAEPDPELLAQMREVYLDMEGEIEK